MLKIVNPRLISRNLAIIENISGHITLNVSIKQPRKYRILHIWIYQKQLPGCRRIVIIGGGFGGIQDSKKP